MINKLFVCSQLTCSREYGQNQGQGNAEDRHRHVPLLGETELKAAAQRKLFIC